MPPPFVRSRFGWARMCVVALVACFADQRALPYLAAEHTDIATQAQGKYIAYAQDLSHPCVGAGAISLTGNWNVIANWVIHEDDPDNCFEHFWDPTGDDDAGLFWIWQRHSAYHRASEFWPLCLDAYAAGIYATAYEDLGRISHLTADMGVPAHVQLDPHGSWAVHQDWYEYTWIPLNRIPVSGTAVAAASDIHGIMFPLAVTSDHYPSVDRDGTQYTRQPPPDGWGPAPWTATEGALMRDHCYVGAVSQTGGMFKYFYDTIKPFIQLGPIDAESCHRGSQIELSSFPLSYGYWFRISRVEYSFLIHDSANAPDAWDRPAWTILGDGTNSAGHVWTYTANISSPEANSQWVWMRAQAVDEAQCESAPVIRRIKVDSEPPTITIVGQ